MQSGGHILITMRLAALVMTLVVGAAPAALTACEIACAMASDESRDASSVHSCHGSPRHDASSIGAGTHACGHEDELLPAGKFATAQTAVPAAVAVRRPFFSHEPTARAAAGAALPPGTFTPPTPLRI
jgi:hypothetical protein